MATFKLELISPQQIMFEGEARSVMIPGAEGDMTVLPGHAPMVTLVNPGIIEAVDADGNELQIFVSRALAEITATDVTILAERAVAAEELAQEHIDVEITRLQASIEAGNDDTARSNARSLIWRLEQIRIG